METTSYGVFAYYPDGQTQVEVHPDPPTPEEARPFYVVWGGESWMPITVLVFARDVEHAKARVRAALVACREGAKAWKDKHDYVHTHQAVRILEEEAAGRLTVACVPVDIARIIAEVVWAGNGGCR